MNRVQEYVDKNRDRTLSELCEFLRIPSVSADERMKSEMGRCAEFVAGRLRDIGLKTVLHPTAGHPIIYAELLDAPGKPTVLVYGHYDVQPPDPIDLWRHGPFAPTVEDGFVVARGATDDKGQVYSLIKGVQAALAVNQKLPVNLKVLIEGEEEVGSPNLEPFVRREKARLGCDIVLISDGNQFAVDIPAITYGLKGIVYIELIVRGPGKDLHSGSFGGAVANPANVLARMLSACQGPFGKVAIPGFYDRVRDLEKWERDEFLRLPFSEQDFVRDTGVPQTTGEEGYTTLERKWARPTFDINGLVSGFTGEGAKTVLPAVAKAKFSMRLVPDQDPLEIRKLAQSFLEEIAPPEVKIEILHHHGAKPVLLERKGPAVAAAVSAIEATFGRKPAFTREGGSIPVVSTFKEALNADSLLVGLGLPDDNAHSPNERFRILDYYRGMVFMANFLEALSR